MIQYPRRRETDKEAKKRIDYLKERREKMNTPVLIEHIPFQYFPRSMRRIGIKAPSRTKSWFVSSDPEAGLTAWAAKEKRKRRDAAARKRRQLARLR